jgi:excisionase family DNA binding protein
MKNYYSSQEIAELCGLHLKTVQKFMREGKLPATKIGREWRVSGNELSRFMEGDNFSSTPSENDSGVTGQQRKFNYLAIIEIAVRDFEEASSFSNLIIGSLNNGRNDYQHSGFEFVYNDQEKKAKLIFKGDALFIADMMICFKDLEDNQNE